jgi:hypothetical protein
MIRVCRKCGEKIPNRIRVNGKSKSLQRRQFCINCSPYGKHNTKKSIDDSKDGFKTCCSCKECKPLSEFHKKTGIKLHSYCKPCLYEIQRARWIQRKKDAVIYLGGKCSKCGYDKNFSALDFHHRDSTKKEFDWGRLRLMAKTTVKKELDKCDILCSNCHQELHNPNCNM